MSKKANNQKKNIIEQEEMEEEIEEGEEIENEEEEENEQTEKEEEKKRNKKKKKNIENEIKKTKPKKIKEKKEIIKKDKKKEESENKKGIKKGKKKKIEENIEEEEIEEEEEKDHEGMFIHEKDIIQKSNKSSKKTLMIPKRKLNVEDKNNYYINQTSPNNEKFDIDENVLEYINNEQELTNDDSGNRYFNFEEILCLEDPFMRVSRPSAFNNSYQRVSAFNRRIKTTKTKNRKKEYLFKEKPKTFKEKENLKINLSKSFDNTEQRDKLLGKDENIIIKDKTHEGEENEEKEK
jgi:hypothetical protein